MTYCVTARSTRLPFVASGSRRLFASVLCTLLAGTVGSCGDSTAPKDDPGIPERVIKVAGDSQTVVPGSAVPVPPAVRVTDRHGNAIGGARVLFTVAAGDGSVIGGDVTTDSNGVATVGSWTLGTTKGTNLLTASAGEGVVASFTATAGENSPDITPRILLPQVGSLVGDSAQISIMLTSRYELASVRAAVGATQVSLSYSTERNRWEGIFPLHDMPRDSLQLVVTARDVNGSATDAFVIFVHDRPPTLTVTAPATGTVAHPSIEFTADCADDDPAGCASLEVGAEGNTTGYRVLVTGQSHVGTTVSLSDFDGQYVRLGFHAIDSRGQVVHAFRTIYVEASTELSEIASVDGTVMDLRGDQLLYRSPDRAITLMTATSGATHAIYLDTTHIGLTYPPYGFVTSSGAILGVRTSTATSAPYAKVLEWRNGTLLDLGGLDDASSLQVNGDYAIFSNGRTLTRRDLASGTNITISGDAGNNANGLAPNGDVAFRDRDYQIHLYHNGTTTLLTPDDGTGREENTHPVTDGVNVVYTHRESPLVSFPSVIVLHNSTGDTVLAYAGLAQPIDYAVNSGWTAFTKPGIGEVLQIWTRSPTGELRQLSSFGTDSKISAIGSDGTVIFENNSRRYLTRPGGTPYDVMSALGTVLWRDGRFVALIGRTAFEIAR